MRHGFGACAPPRGHSRGPAQTPNVPLQRRSRAGMGPHPRPCATGCTSETALILASRRPKDIESLCVHERSVDLHDRRSRSYGGVGSVSLVLAISRSQYRIDNTSNTSNTNLRKPRVRRWRAQSRHGVLAAPKQTYDATVTCSMCSHITALSLARTMARLAIRPASVIQHRKSPAHPAGCAVPSGVPSYCRSSSQWSPALRFSR